MHNSGKRLIEVVTTHVGESPAQAIIRGWEYLPEKRNPDQRRSSRLGDDGKTWRNPRKITETLEGDAHSFYKIAKVAWGDRGDGDRPGLDALGGRDT